MLLTKRIIFLLSLSLTHGLLAQSFSQVQSEFRGPVEGIVWKHWQASWNVEVNRGQGQFRLTRGRSSTGSPLVKLDYRGDLRYPKAILRGKRRVRSGVWEVGSQEIPAVSVSQQVTGGDSVSFVFSDGAKDFLDLPGEQTLLEINFAIFDGDVEVFQHSLTPMFIRGKNSASYWTNEIDPVLAHNGEGSISVSTMLAAENTWEQMNGVLVQPNVSFVERNTLAAGSRIGLHRHEKNQEMYFIEEGRLMMSMGMAKKSSDIYEVTRTFDSLGNSFKTQEFEIAGGWVETREMNPGDFSVIVPNPIQSRYGEVYFHGIDALENSVFWTAGSKN